MRTWLARTRVWAVTMAAGGGLLALEGCDPAVRDTVLAGVGEAATGLASTFIEAFIQSLQSEEETADTATTVRGLDVAASIFA